MLMAPTSSKQPRRNHKLCRVCAKQNLVDYGIKHHLRAMKFCTMKKALVLLLLAGLFWPSCQYTQKIRDGKTAF